MVAHILSILKALLTTLLYLTVVLVAILILFESLAIVRVLLVLLTDNI